MLQDPSGNTVTAALAYNAATNTATLTPNAALAASTTYTATVSGAVDLAGTVMTSPPLLVVHHRHAAGGRQHDALGWGHRGGLGFNRHGDLQRAGPE